MTHYYRKGWVRCKDESKICPSCNLILYSQWKKFTDKLLCRKCNGLYTEEELYLFTGKEEVHNVVTKK